MLRKQEEKRKKQAAIRQMEDRYGMSWTWDDDDDFLTLNFFSFFNHITKFLSQVTL